MGPAEQKARLQDLAEYLYELIMIFKNDDEIKSNEPYKLISRLFNEQCELANEETSKEESSKVYVKKKPEGEKPFKLPMIPMLRMDIKE